ncbi:MAG: hypothetical protein KDK36_09165, partial [Leptospiraceae bacterium]|nr:hypothetical protein [Leptospiraceae bacterium]
EMLVIDGIYLSAARTKASKESKPDVLYSTIAHELQHLIRFPYELKRSNITSPIDPLTLPSTITFDDTWINEGTSEVISDIAGYGPQSDRIKCFRGDPSNTNSSCTNGFIAKSMISWSSNILNYSYAYAFMNYLYYNSGTSTTTRNSFLKSTTTGSSTRGSSITGLMSVFKNASNYSSTLLSSDTSTMFKRLFALFLAQTLKYSSSSTAYYGSTTGSSMSSLYSTYSYPSNLTSLMNLPTYLPTVTGSSFELYPTVSYRVSGTSSGPSNSNAVVVQSTGSEYVIFNGSTSSSSYITTSASVKSNQQSESNLPGFDMKAVFSYPEQKDFCTHQYFIERFLHKNNNILHY